MGLNIFAPARLAEVVSDLWHTPSRFCTCGQATGTCCPVVQNSLRRMPDKHSISPCHTPQGRRMVGFRATGVSLAVHIAKRGTASIVSGGLPVTSLHGVNVIPTATDTRPRCSSLASNMCLIVPIQIPDMGVKVKASPGEFWGHLTKQGLNPSVCRSRVPRTP